MSEYCNYKDYGHQKEEKVELKKHEVVSVVEVGALDDKMKLIDERKNVVVKIWKEGCPPCVHIAPKYMKLAAEYTPKGVTFASQHAKYLVRGSDPPTRAVPAFHFYRNGLFIDTVLGADIRKIEDNVLALSK